MRKYQKKSSVIEAVQLRWSEWDEVCELLGGIACALRGGARAVESHYSETCGDHPPFAELMIPTPDGLRIARHGDFVIKNARGEFYPCKPAVFRETYEAVGLDDANQKA